jgi:hypothetical protein
MSYEIVLRPSQSRAKVRNPWGVLGLTVITFGVYGAFWWYFVNREMRDLGRARNTRDLGDSPGLSTLALTLGGYLIVPAIWTLVTTCQRIQRAQRLTGRADVLNGWIVVALMIFTFGLGVHVYMQSELNKAWQSDEIEAAQNRAAMRPQPTTATDDLDRITKLAGLRASGALTDAEYEVEKDKVLNPY